MALFKKIKIKVPVVISPIEADEVLVKLANDDNMNDIISVHGSTLVDIVIAEANLIENRANGLMQGSIPIVEEIRDVEGNITQAAEYLNASNQTKLEDELTSELLTINVVVNAIIDWNIGDPGKGRNWTQYKNSFN